MLFLNAEPEHLWQEDVDMPSHLSEQWALACGKLCLNSFEYQATNCETSLPFFFQNRTKANWLLHCADMCCVTLCCSSVLLVFEFCWIFISFVGKARQGLVSILQEGLGRTTCFAFSCGMRKRQVQSGAASLPKWQMEGRKLSVVETLTWVKILQWRYCVLHAFATEVP